MDLCQVLLRNSKFPPVAFFKSWSRDIFRMELLPKRPPSSLFFKIRMEYINPSKKHTTSYQIMSKYYLSPFKQSSESQAWRKSSRNTRTFSLVPGGTAALTCVAIGATTTKEMTLKESCQWYRKVMGDADAGRWCQMVLQLDNMWFVKLCFSSYAWFDAT